MQNFSSFSIRGRSPPCFPLSDFQLNPPQQRWQLATDDGGLDVLGRTEHAAPDVLVDDDDDAALDLRADLPAVLAHLTNTAGDDTDSTTAQLDEDGSSSAAATTTKLLPPTMLHDPATCIICGTGRSREGRMDDEPRSGKEEAVEWTADEDEVGQTAAADREVSLLQMNDLLFLIWDYLPLSQVLHFQHICPRWKDLLRLKPGSEQEEERELVQEQRRQEERDEAGDAEAVRRIQREMHHIREQYEHGPRAAAVPPPLPLPLARLPPLLADFDSLFGRQLAFYRAVTGRGGARDEVMADDAVMRDEVRRMNGDDLAAITSELEDMDEAEDDAVMAEGSRQRRVRQRERRLERQHAKRARLTPAFVRALWERAHDRPTSDTSSSVSLASTAAVSSSSSLSRSPPTPLRSSFGVMGSMDGTKIDADESMMDDGLPSYSPVLRRPALSLSSFSSSRPLSSTSTSVPSSSSFASSSSSLSACSSPSFGAASASAGDALSLSTWSSRSYLRRLTHAKLSLSPFINPCLSPAILSSLSSVVSLQLYHFPFVRTVFESECEGVEAEAEEVRQLKEEKEAGEREERRLVIAQQKQEKTVSKQLPDDAVKAAMREMDRRRRESGQVGEMDMLWARRAMEADDRVEPREPRETRETREARDARDCRRTPPARLVAALMRQARLLATHRPTRGEAPPLHLLKPLAAQLTTIVYSPACWTARDMEQLQALTSLTSLSIHCQMSESGMRSHDQIVPFLSSFPSLLSLSLYCQDDGATFPSNFVPHLSLLQSTLTSLAVHSSHWKADHVATIATLTNLQSLTISFTTTPITHAHLSSFIALTHLTSLTLHCGTHLSYPLPPSLFALTTLTSLAVFGSVNVHQSAFHLLTHLTELQRLRVSDCFDSLNGLLPYLIACAQLRVLDVRGSAMSWRHREMLRCERPDIKVLESAT